MENQSQRGDCGQGKTGDSCSQDSPLRAEFEAESEEMQRTITEEEQRRASLKSERAEMARLRKADISSNAPKSSRKASKGAL